MSTDSFGVDAATMLFERHERGIHALRNRRQRAVGCITGHESVQKDPGYQAMRPGT
jgi:hypothetical protein